MIRRSSCAVTAYSLRSLAYSRAAGTLWTEQGLQVIILLNFFLTHESRLAYPTTTTSRSSSPLRIFSVANRPSSTVCAESRVLGYVNIKIDSRTLWPTREDLPVVFEEESVVESIWHGCFRGEKARLWKSSPYWGQTLGVRNVAAFKFAPNPMEELTHFWSARKGPFNKEVYGFKKRTDDDMSL